MATEAGVRTIQPAGKGALPTIRLATILGMLATAALLGVVSATAGLGVAGWIAGLATGSAATALLVTARMRSDQPAIFPADWVTLTRMLPIAGVAGLVADSFGGLASTTALVTLSTVALVLDAVDGQVARRTGTATPLGAGHRRRPLRAPASGLADPVAGRAVAAPVLAQGRSRGPGHRAHRRGIR